MRYRLPDCPWQFLTERSEERPDGCIVWTRAVTPDGYGGFAQNHRAKYGESSAHRLAFRVYYGRSAVGMVCHHCDVPARINPLHFFEGDSRANSADRDRKGRSRPHGSRIPWEAVKARKGCASAAQVAEEFGCSARRVREIWCMA